jgi:hypothetical protein
MQNRVSALVYRYALQSESFGDWHEGDNRLRCQWSTIHVAKALEIDFNATQLVDFCVRRILSVERTIAIPNASKTLIESNEPIARDRQS